MLFRATWLSPTDLILPNTRRIGASLIPIFQRSAPGRVRAGVPGDRRPREESLYGAGIHVCPGAPLARLELRIVIGELLSRTRTIVMVANKQPVGAVYPASGFSSLPLRIA